MSVGAAISLHADRPHIGQEHHRELPDVAIETGSGELRARDRIGGAQDLQALRVYGTDDANGQAGPGEGMTPHDLGGQPELESYLAHLVLEEGAQRFDEREGEVIRKAADIVVALDIGRARATARLNDIGVERPLHEEVDGAPRLPRLRHDIARGVLEDADELAADDLALLLGVGHARERVQEALLGIDNDEPHARGRDEVALDLLGLARAQ